MIVAGAYYTVLASLPALPDFEHAQRLPINAERLRQRLAMLRAAEAAGLAEARALLAPQAPLPLAPPPGLPPIALAAAAWRAMTGTLVAGLRLRLRRAGAGPPGRAVPFGTAPWGERVRRHWNAPDFGCGRTHPWLARADALLAAGRSVELETLLLRLAWRRWGELAAGHRFDSAALLMWLARWDIVEWRLRWSGLGAVAAFGALVVRLVPQAGDGG